MLTTTKRESFAPFPADRPTDPPWRQGERGKIPPSIILQALPAPLPPSPWRPLRRRPSTFSSPTSSPAVLSNNLANQAKPGQPHRQEGRDTQGRGRRNLAKSFRKEEEGKTIAGSVFCQVPEKLWKSGIKRRAKATRTKVRATRRRNEGRETAKGGLFFVRRNERKRSNFSCRKPIEREERPEKLELHSRISFVVSRRWKEARWRI